MPDFTVRQYGTDSSGRRIFMTVYMHDWWESVVAELGFRPVVIQGAFMVRNGGGAADSSGYHDQGGCMDVRTRDLTTPQVDALVRTARDHGAAAWRRDRTARHGGMDPHCHITLGTDFPLSPGARVSWEAYLSGGDGISGPGRDYEWRPDPLVLTPPPEDDMPYTETELIAIVKAAVHEALDAEKVDKDGKVSVRQAINQIRNANARASK